MENMTTLYAVAEHEYDLDRYWDRFFKSVDIMSAVIYSLVGVFGVLGNYIVYRVTRRMKKTVKTVWILQLTLADFVVSFSLWLNVTQSALDNRWPFGWFMCKYHSLVFYNNVYTSIYGLVLMSVDRCVCVVSPSVWFRHRHRTARNAKWVSMGVFVMAVALSIPHVISRELDFGLCLDFPDPPLVITNLLVGFAFPFFVIVSCYSVSIYRNRNSRLLRGPHKIIIAVFFLCWAPFHIIRLIQVYATKTETMGIVLEFGVPVSLALAVLNSCLKPLLYAFTGGRFRLVFRESILTVLEKAFAEDQPNNTPTDTQLQEVLLVTRASI